MKKINREIYLWIDTLEKNVWSVMMFLTFNLPDVNSVLDRRRWLLFGMICSRLVESFNGCLIEKRLRDFFTLISRWSMLQIFLFKSRKFWIENDCWRFSSIWLREDFCLLDFLICNVSFNNCNCFFHDDRFGVRRFKWLENPSW